MPLPQEDTLPPPRRPLQRTVRILPECILVLGILFARDTQKAIFTSVEIFNLGEARLNTDQIDARPDLMSHQSDYSLRDFLVFVPEQPRDGKKQARVGERPKLCSDYA